jgi:CRP-like cAMP-binding protein
MSKPIRSLAGVRGLACLPADQLERLAKACKWRDHPPRAEIIAASDETADVFFLVAGVVTARMYSATGQAVDFRDIPAGEMFGEVAAIDGGARSATIETRTAATIARLSRQRFWVLIDTEPEFRRAVLGRLTAMVRTLSDRVVEFSTLKVRGRLHAELIRLSKADGTATGFIEKLPTHSELARRISTHREAVTREIAALRRSRAVVSEERGLRIDVARLRQLIEDDR